MPVLCRVRSSVAVVVAGDGVRERWERGTAAQIRRGSSRQLLPYRGTASGCRFFAVVGSSVAVVVGSVRELWERGTAARLPVVTVTLSRRPAVQRSTCEANQRFNRLAVCRFAVPVCRGLWLCVVGVRPWQCGRVLCAALPSVVGCCLVPVSVHRWPLWLVVMVSGNGGREARRHGWR